MLLSAALIVRDEAAHLDGCLTSLSELVDEIVVVDTGSTDFSVDIARRHRAVVANEPWRDDFSAPRNRSLELASGEWILYIDADERVAASDPAAVRKWLAAASDHIAYRVRFIPRVGWTPYHEYRLFRNHPDIRFRGVIHETIVNDVHLVADRDELQVSKTDVLTIEHVGYEGDQQSKHERNEPILMAALDDRPDRTFLYDHLARIYEDQGASEHAVAMWERGIDVARARNCAHHDDRLVFIDLIVHLLARNQTGGEFETLLAEALERFPNIPPLELAAGSHEFATGRTELARARAEWLTSLTLENIVATGSSYDERVLGEWAWNLLGLCRFELGDDAGAADAFRRAEAAAPDGPAYAVRRRLAEARAAAHLRSR